MRTRSLSSCPPRSGSGRRSILPWENATQLLLCVSTCLTLHRVFSSVPLHNLFVQILCPVLCHQVSIQMAFLQTSEFLVGSSLPHLIPEHSDLKDIFFNTGRGRRQLKKAEEELSQGRKYSRIKGHQKKRIKGHY